MSALPRPVTPEALSGSARVPAAEISVIEFGGHATLERQFGSLAEWTPATPARAVTWINVDNVRDSAAASEVGARFNLHPLAIEDVVTPRQRPKLDDYGDYLFVVLKMLTRDARAMRVEIEQVSIVVMPGLVISFQGQTPHDVFEPVREAVRTSKGRIVNEGADYLAYSLIDAIVDHYFVILESVGDDIDALEDEIVAQPTQETMRRLHELKRELAFVRNSIWPLREVVGRLERDDSPLISAHTRVYLRDVYDHTVQIIETIETYRDITAGMLDIYLSSISNALNSVMKVLTVIATIFIPLTFITSLYGMNFKHMPELNWVFGYPLVLALMVGVSGVMLLYFRRRGWI